MAILVDGYNFMHAVQASLAGDNSFGRLKLCRLLGDWGQAKGITVTIVFDGVEPTTAVAGQLSDTRVRVIYSGGQRTADAAIAELLNISTDPRHLTVITSDHEVQRSARHRRAQVIESELFYKQVLRELSQSERKQAAADAGERSRTVDEAESAAWLDVFGYDPKAEDDFEHP